MAGSRGLTCSDMVALARVSGPAVSPDGKWVVYNKKTWDAASNKWTNSLFLVSTSGDKSLRLTTMQQKSDHGAVWDPSSEFVFFLSNRSGSSQIWVISIHGGEAQQVTSYPVDVESMRFSADGSHVVFSARVYGDINEGDVFAQTAARDKAKEGKVLPKHYSKLYVRRWDTWEDDKLSHLFISKVERTSAGFRVTDATPRDLMKSVSGHCPVPPFGDSECYSVTADASEVAYATHTGEDIAWSTNTHIYTVSTAPPQEGGGAPLRVSTALGANSSPVYSPDGRYLAFLAMSTPKYESDRNRITIFDKQTGASRILADSWDRSPDSLAWTADSSCLVATAGCGARGKVFSINVLSGEVREVVGVHSNSEVSLVPGQDALVHSQSSFVSPADVWISQLDGSSSRPLTRANQQALEALELVAPEELFFPGAKGETVQAWFFKPAGFTAGERYPLVVLVHGGPQVAFTDIWSYRWNPNAFAGAGYAVLIINFHGSPSFGQAFTDSITLDWGGAPFEDIMKGTDFALQRFPWLNPARTAAIGASYGGFMMNWINGNTDRFSCLINHDGVFDLTSMYYTTEELFFCEHDLGNNEPEFEAPEQYTRFNPLRFVRNWKTPVLVIQGGLDFRVPPGQALGTFTALQRKKIPSELLFFPDENHWVLKPQNSLVWHDTCLKWLARFLKAAA
eukprot:gnl/Hemi2/16548_TR5539_c0_g1_i1.p1 gnl/Hemi2/16548_TR5539_c0_g1~~gnl/Hemi2/16548_TR5539_c0_g1_i1.p1  ORF type:complete len:693 (-),score=213.38 gnl/Hemi2/16548_TR5539_c0_g1_i1:39-2078(-)